jgi:hypothetical protein
MMKKLMVLCLGLFVTGMVFAADQITIPLEHSFNLNPVLGITGTANDPDSRFVQRILFSPLVVPKTDPTIDMDFQYDLTVSLLDRQQDIRYDTADDSQNPRWREVSLGSFSDEIMSNHFLVYLNKDMSFVFKGQKYDSLTAEDVVFSYRLAQTTLSRKDSGGNLSEADQRFYNYTNAILRAKIGGLRSISCEDAYSVEFLFNEKKTVKQLLEFMVYTPIVSVKQLFPLNNTDKKRYVREDEFRFSPRDDTATREKNKVYDMRDKIYESGLKVFQESPASYGQYYVRDKAGLEPGTGMMRNAKSVELAKNTEWAKNAAENSELMELGLGMHTDYVNNMDRLKFEFIQNRRGFERLKAISEKREKLLITNFPLTGQAILQRPGLFAPKNTDDTAKAYSLISQKMHISYKLYGLVYSTQSRMFNAPENRAFFRDCLNRGALIQRIKASVQIRRWANERDRELLRNMLNQIEITPLYYPFYEGVSRIDTGKLSELYNTCKESDHSMDDTESLERMIADSVAGKAEDLNLIEGIMSGRHIQDDLLDSIIQKYTELKEVSMNPDERIDANPNQITIRIIYNGEPSSVDAEIAKFYKENLNTIFGKLKEEGYIDKKVNLSILVKETTQLSNKPSSIMDANPAEFDIAVYGWNYRIDFLGEFAKQIHPTKRSRLESQYELLLAKMGTVTAVNDLLLQISEEIVKEQTITTLLGIQNYVLYDKNRIAMDNLGDDKLGQFSMLYPYYWRRTREVR